MATSDPFLVASTSNAHESHLEHLPAATRSQLRSTQILTSLSQVVSELLQNSLDAGARQIEIGVDCEEWTCWVRDDGSGISKNSMNMLAQEHDETRYGSSKAYSPDSLGVVSTFGFRGEALASAAYLSCLEISSRTSKSRESWSVILKSGRCLYNGPSTRWRREYPGTVVCIRDAFYNLPIRRLSHPSPLSTINSIRRELETYALMFPEVSFSLENTTNVRDGTPNTTRIIKIPKTNSTLAAFRHLYGRALAEHVDEISETLGEARLEGFISLEGAHSKAYQFLYVNRHPLASCDLHQVIQNRFNTSSFSKNALDEVGETGLPRSTVRRSPRKTERRPVYVLNLTLPSGHIDNCLEPAKASVHLKDRDMVLSLLSTVVQTFLVRHGFVTNDSPNRKRNKRDESASPQPSPSKTRKHHLVIEDLPRVTNRTTTNSTLVSEDNTPDDDCTSVYAYQDDLAAEGNDEMTWKDPNTGEYFVIDQRTGNSYPKTRPSVDHPESVSLEGSSSRSRRTLTHTLKNANKESEGTATVPDWIEQALLENRTYGLTEPKIPVLSCSVLPIMDKQIRHSSSNWHSCGDGPNTPDHYFRMRLNKTGTDEVTRCFRKEDLRNARIIHQVDRKFIACLVNDGLETPDGLVGGQTLVLIDQHAADERIRVERFLKEICIGFLSLEGSAGGPRTRLVSPAISFLLTRREAYRLGCSDDVRTAFKRWGFDFGDLPRIADSELECDGGEGYVQVSVERVPEIVGEKLLAGDDLRELVKGFLCQLETDTASFPSASTLGAIRDDKTETGWMKALRWCPSQLLDLINSRACRGAIMFNDTLSMDQCEQLVRRLSGTLFPFQCAHGRPSLVPLVSVGAGLEIDNRERRPSIEWSKFGRQRA